MDTFEVLNNLLVKLFNDILDVEEKALITDEFKDISVTDMHIIEAVGTEEPRTMTANLQNTRRYNGNTYYRNECTCQKGYIIRTTQSERQKNRICHTHTKRRECIQTSCCISQRHD